MALFNGVENFTPAFTGQQLAIQSGQGAGQSISRGQQTARGGKAQSLDEQQFQFQKQKYEAEQPSVDELSRLFEFLRTGMP